MSFAGVAYVTAAILMASGIISAMIVSFASVLFIMLIIAGELYLLYAFIRSMADYTIDMNKKVDSVVEIRNRLLKLNKHE